MTELIWDGKYDKDGRRVAPLRVSLPFQTVETVNESAQERQRALDLWSAGRDPDWRNRLIWGDKKYVLPSLLQEFAGKVNLIYIDPPFNVGADFSFTAAIPEDPETGEAGGTFVKEPSVIEMKAYRDTWGRGLDSYLQWFYETVVSLRELLAEDGSIYVHLDWHIGHYAKVVLDEAFGISAFRNEIIWWYYDKFPTGGNILDRQHDVLFQYAKSDKFTTNRVTEPRVEPGRPTEVRKKVQGKMVRIRDPQTGRTTFVEGTTEKKISDVWRIPVINSMSLERLGYDTQKPEALLERIINASSNDGDLVLDCFAGSGTTAAVAEKLNRRWIVCDLSRFAIHTTRKRLLSIPNIRPFVVQNLGKYERQAWQAAEFGESAEARALAYRRFILDLYGAQPFSGAVWLHGVRHGRMVHVGSVDAPIAVGDVTNLVTEFKRTVGTGAGAPTSNGIDLLGWDFAFELNEVARQQAAQAKVDLRFLRIPRDVMDKRAVEQGDIRFFELAALAVEVQASRRKVTLTLTDFVIPPDDVPQEVQKAITHWSQWIDYWAVDWDNRDDAFHNEWQTYRTRQSRELQRTVSHTYDASGEYRVVVKVIDILGNDTTKTLMVRA